MLCYRGLANATVLTLVQALVCLVLKVRSGLKYKYMHNQLVLPTSGDPLLYTDSIFPYST